MQQCLPGHADAGLAAADDQSLSSCVGAVVTAVLPKKAVDADEANRVASERQRHRSSRTGMVDGSTQHRRITLRMLVTRDGSGKNRVLQ